MKVKMVVTFGGGDKTVIRWCTGRGFWVAGQVLYLDLVDSYEDCLPCNNSLRH